LLTLLASLALPPAQNWTFLTNSLRESCQKRDQPAKIGGVPAKPAALDAPLALADLPPAATASFGALLKFLRRRAQLSQHELGLAVGYSEAQISRLERNKRLPDLMALAARYVPALHLENEPLVAAKLLALAAAARGEPLPAESSTGLAHLAQFETPPAAEPQASLAANLPNPLTPFISRVRETAELTRLLSVSRAVTLTGPGGAGKTRLALQVAAETAGRYPQGVYVVELAALADPALVLPAVAQAFGLREAPGQPLLNALLGHLQPRELLLVLDNCEHLILACAQLAETLLQACPRLHLLATSREPMGIGAEVTWLVPGLAMPDLGADNRLDPHVDYDALNFFVERAQAALPSFALSDHSRRAVAELCRRLDGIPLAIELAAPLVRALSPEQIANRLGDRFGLLTAGSRTALPRQQTLRGAMDWSYELLAPAERVLFRRLAVFSGGWTLEAAEQICAEPDLADQNTVMLLYQLVTKSLVTVDSRGRDARYRLLETVRQYAAEKLLAAGEAPEIRGRHLGFFSRLAEEAGTHAWRPEELEWLARLDADLDNLRAALSWALDPAGGAPRDAALRLAAPLKEFWRLRCHYVEAHGWLEKALARADPRPSSLRARGLLAYAVMMPMMFSGEQARQVVEQSLAMARESGDRLAEADALFYLATRALEARDTPRADALFAEANTLFAALGNLQGQAGILGTKALMDLHRGNFARSEGTAEQALSLYRQLGALSVILWITENLSYLAIVRGGMERGALLVQEAERIAHVTGNTYWIAYSLWTVAHIAFRQADYARAQALLEEFAALFQQITDTESALKGRHWQGQIACYQGNYAGALALQEEALAEFRRLHPNLDDVPLKNAQALTHLYLGDLVRARELAEPAAAAFRERAEPHHLALALYHLGSAAYHQADLAQAAELLDEALAASRACGDARALGLTLHALGRLALAGDDLDGAAGHFTESLAVRRGMGARRGIAETLEGFGALAARRKQPGRAARLLGAAEALRAAIGAPVPVVERAEHQRHLALTRRQLGDRRFDLAWTAGTALRAERAMDLALETA